ncbi:chloride channel protein [Flavitalea sp.]|nr:chloride channel protein [Flavitalea sp.]
MRIKAVPKSIPIATSLNFDKGETESQWAGYHRGKRLVFISSLAVLIALVISFISKLLVLLINFTTGFFFFGKLSVADISPASNNLGWLVIFIPAIGGIIVGLMALYGSKAIRGHGIPEAMEQVLTNHSKIRPSITYLKPVSAAIAIGAGGPFGAEGPIIATGGALGSTVGQLLKITSNERKILLAAGSTAGMSAIFGSPVAAIFLAIELLLFEFSPRAIIPVALACITGAAGHHFLFESGPVFAIRKFIGVPSNTGLFLYSCMGIIIGIISVGVTRIVYFVEDLFEKLPVHWMWWPAIGGLFVGVIGYMAPGTLGVGYNNITDILNGELTLSFIAILCILKFCSWAIALGSGTSGGTLAPLLTIGSAAGAILGYVIMKIFPAAGVTIGLSALVGMATMFTGASRAFLTSIAFALETTGQFNGLVPLLAACTAAYFISYLLMENTIMTEKISRRGVQTPVAYGPDILQSYTVKQVMNNDALVIKSDITIGDLQLAYLKSFEHQQKNIIVVGADNKFEGLLNASDILKLNAPEQQLLPVKTVLTEKTLYVRVNDTVRFAMEKMIAENVEFLPVLRQDKTYAGFFTQQAVFNTHKLQMVLEKNNVVAISLRRQRFRMLVKRNQVIASLKKS